MLGTERDKRSRHELGRAYKRANSAGGGLPLLIIKGSKGFLGCGYINAEACNKTGEACAIVTGVKSHNDMPGAEIKAVSHGAQKLGVRIGMKGEQALEIFR